MSNSRRGKPSRLNRILAILMVVGAVLLVVIVSGTIWAFASGKARPGSASVRVNQRLMVGAEELTSDEVLFSRIGRLRIPLSGISPTTLVLYPHFVIPSGDSAFSEEIIRKISVLRTAITSWCSERTAQEISTIGESAVKTALLQEINGQLVLGSINTVYFSEYEIFQ